MKSDCPFLQCKIPCTISYWLQNHLPFVNALCFIISWWNLQERFAVKFSNWYFIYGKLWVQVLSSEAAIFCQWHFTTNCQIDFIHMPTETLGLQNFVVLCIFSFSGYYIKQFFISSYSNLLLYLPYLPKIIYF